MLGRDLDRGDSRGSDALRVVLGRLIAGERRGADILSQQARGGFDERCFARARAPHEIDGDDVAGGEPAPDVVGERIVAAEYFLLKGDTSHSLSSKATTRTPVSRARRGVAPPQDGHVTGGSSVRTTCPQW